MKKFLLGVLVMLLISLCGCGEKPKTEEEIWTDLQAHSDFWNVQEVAIEELTLIKRQTDEKNKTDKVYVSVIAGNDNVECQLGYCLNYGLYDSGWVLDSVNDYAEGGSKILPKKGPSEEEVKKYLPEEGYVVKTIGEADLENGICAVEYEKVMEYPLVERVILYTEQLAFNEHDAAWISIGSEYAVTEYWQIEGHWQLTTPKDSFVYVPERRHDLYISEVDTDGFYAEVIVNGETVFSGIRDNFVDPIVYEAGLTTYLAYITEDEIKFTSGKVFEKIE